MWHVLMQKLETQMEKKFYCHISIPAHTDVWKKIFVTLRTNCRPSHILRFMDEMFFLYTTDNTKEWMLKLD